MSAALLLGLAAAHPAAAELLVFTCTMTQTWKDGTALKIGARIEITPETLSYIEYHEYGGKMKVVGQGTIEKIETDKVTFSDDSVKTYYINRTTGEEYWRDERRGAEEGGICKEGV